MEAFVHEISGSHSNKYGDGFLDGFGGSYCLHHQSNDVGSKLLQNVGHCLPDCMAQHARIHLYSLFFVYYKMK